MATSRPIRLRGRTLCRLALRAEPLTDSPNAVLRRVLGLDPPRRRRVAGRRPAPDTFPAWVLCRVDGTVYQRLADLRDRRGADSLDAVVWALVAPQE